MRPSTLGDGRMFLPQQVPRLTVTIKEARQISGLSHGRVLLWPSTKVFLEFRTRRAVCRAVGGEAGGLNCALKDKTNRRRLVRYGRELLPDEGSREPKLARRFGETANNVCWQRRGRFAEQVPQERGEHGRAAGLFEKAKGLIPRVAVILHDAAAPTSRHCHRTARSGRPMLP